MIRIGLAGMGFMGWTHFASATRLTEKGTISGSKLKGGAVRGFCTRSAEKLAGDWTSIQGNFGPRGPKVDVGSLSAYDNLKEFVSDPDLDLIDICLPNNQHEEAVLLALKHGKDVLVEKPIAVDLKGAERMVKAARDAGRLLMVAHVLPFFPEFQFAAQAVASGKYGRLRAAHFRRVISPPKWSAEMSDFRSLGGWGIDLHIHDNHFIGLIGGTPQQVYSRGILEEGLVTHVQTQYHFADPELTVTSLSGGIAADGLSFTHGYELYFEKASLVFSAGTLAGEWVVDRPLSVFANGKITHPTLKTGEWCSAFTSELQLAVNAVKTREVPRALSADLALDALRVCHAEAKSIATGKPVKVK